MPKKKEKDVELPDGFHVTSFTTEFTMLVNLGNYESAKIHKGVTMAPNNPGDSLKDIDGAMKKAKKYVRNSVFREIKETLKMETIDG